MQGSPETHWDITAGIAAANHQIVISVDYALAPEHPFPRALHECTAVTRWAFDQSEALGIDADAIAIGGDSAGGNLAAAVTLVLRGSAPAAAEQIAAGRQQGLAHAVGGGQAEGRVLALETLHRGAIAAHAKHGHGHQDGDEHDELEGHADPLLAARLIDQPAPDRRARLISV